ncbi:hypothetical protein JCM17823_13600 [Halorubrum gandharaense]
MARDAPVTRWYPARTADNDIGKWSPAGVVRMASDTDEHAPNESPAGDDGPLVRRWRGLDRGWQALLLGLAVVAVHLLVQPF